MNKDIMRHIYPIALAHFTLELCNGFLPVIYPILITTMGLTYTQVGFVALITIIGDTLSQPLFGYLSDRWGPRLIVIASIAWIGLIMGLVGLVGNYWVLLLVVGFGALGSAAFHPAGASSSGAVGIDKRGGALAVFSVGGTLGSALSPLLITMAIGLLGLRGTLVLPPIAVAMAIVLYSQWKPSSQVVSNKSQTDTLSASAPAGSLIALVLITLIVMCRSWFHFSFVTYLAEWLQAPGWSLVRRGQALTILSISIGVGCLVGGVLSDKIGRWQVLVLGLGLLAPVYWLFITTSGDFLVFLAACIGFLIGLSFPVTIAAAQESWPRGVGFASALATGIGWLPGGIGASLTGFIADRTSLATGLHWLVVAPLLGVVCALIYSAFKSRDAHQIELGRV